MTKFIMAVGLFLAAVVFDGIVLPQVFGFYENMFLVSFLVSALVFWPSEIKIFIPLLTAGLIIESIRHLPFGAMLLPLTISFLAGAVIFRFLTIRPPFQLFYFSGQVYSMLIVGLPLFVLFFYSSAIIFPAISFKYVWLFWAGVGLIIYTFFWNRLSKLK